MSVSVRGVSMLGKCEVVLVMRVCRMHVDDLCAIIEAIHHEGWLNSC